MNVETIITFLTTQGADFGLKILGALAAWIVGRWLIGLVLRAIGAALERGKKVDATLANYLRSIFNVVLNVVLVLAILDIFGVKTTSFAALLAGAGLAIGTAWGGLLTHFAREYGSAVLLATHGKLPRDWGDHRYVLQGGRLDAIS